MVSRLEVVGRRCVLPLDWISQFDFLTVMVELTLYGLCGSRYKLLRI